MSRSRPAGFRRSYCGDFRANAGRDIDVKVAVAVGVADRHAVALRAKILLKADRRPYRRKMASRTLQINLVLFGSFHSDQQIEVAIVIDVGPSNVLIKPGSFKPVDKLALMNPDAPLL